MPTEEFFRSFRPDLEVRSRGDGRTIYGIAVPYNAPTRITDQLVEEFVHGAFAHQTRAANRVKVSREHMQLGGELIGALSSMEEQQHGLYVEMRVAKTAKGEETLELVRDGALNELSIGFRGREHRTRAGGVVQRIKADLFEVSIVLEGAYASLATAAGVRSAQQQAGGFYGPGETIEREVIDLRARAEHYLSTDALPALEDYETKIRAIRLGLR